jgi:phosphonate transport system permease protein
MKKSPLVAFLLSIVPGLGQIYAGAYGRGISLLLGLPLQALLFRLIGHSALMAWLVLVWIWNLFDAARLARARPAPAALPMLLLIVLNIYAGWRVTEIDPGKLARNLGNMKRIVTGLVEPDVLVPAAETQVATANIVILPPGGRAPAGQEALPTAPPPKPGAPRLMVEPAAIHPPQTVRVTGAGFAPRAGGRLTLIASGHLVLAKLLTDAQGRFDVSADVPPRPPNQYWIEATVQRPLGGWTASETLQLSAVKMAETIFLALMGTLFSVIVTVPLSFFGAKNLMGGSAAGLALYGATRTVMNLLRSVEVMIIALMMVTVVGIGPFAGVLALAIHGVGALGKLYSEAIESIDPGPIEAITATGASRLQVVMFGVVPQVVPQFVAFTIYRWDINVRMATVIGLVGGGGIGFILKNYIDLLQWSQAGTAILLIAVTVIAMDYASALIRERLQ